MGTAARLPEGVYAYETKDGRRLFRAAFRTSSGKSSTKRGFTSARAAAKWRQATLSAARRGEVVTVGRGTLAQLFPRFLDARKPHLSPGTWRDYDVHGRLRILPGLGGLSLSQLDQGCIDEWVLDLWESGGLAPKTINNGLLVLSAFLGWCVQTKRLSQNAASTVRPLPEGHREMDYLRPDEVPRYLESCRPEYRPLAELLIASGMRISEALGLVWDDVDVNAGVVRVLRQAQAGSTGRRRGRERDGIGATKNKRYRVVYVAARVLDLMADYRARQAEIGPVCADSLVFVRYERPTTTVHTPAALARRQAIADDLQAVRRGSTRESQAEVAARHGVSQQLVSLVGQELRGAIGGTRPITRDLVSRSWHKQALTIAGLDDSLRLHDLRHTAAALWLMHGESLYFVQQQLGHRDSKTTERYAHLARGYMANRTNEIDAQVWGARLGTVAGAG
jgi:integrase